MTHEIDMSGASASEQMKTDRSRREMFRRAMAVPVERQVEVASTQRAVRAQRRAPRSIAARQQRRRRSLLFGPAVQPSCRQRT